MFIFKDHSGANPITSSRGGALRHFFRSIPVHFTIGHDIFPEHARSLCLRRAVTLLVSWMLCD